MMTRGGEGGIAGTALSIFAVRFWFTVRPACCPPRAFLKESSQQVYRLTRVTLHASHLHSSRGRVTHCPLAAAITPLTLLRPL